MAEYQQEQWHLDKKVPIALIFAILIQTAGAFWWAATITSRVDNLESKVDITADLKERVIRLEEQTKITNSLLKDIRDELRSK